MKKHNLSILLFVALAGTIALVANTTITKPSTATPISGTQDFVMPDPPVYINTTYNGAVLNTADSTADVAQYSILTIYYKVPHSDYHNNTDDFLRLKGSDGPGILDINMNHGPFFTFVSESGNFSFYKIDYNVTYAGTTEFYAIYNVNTPCGQYLDDAETDRHYIVTTGGTETSSEPTSEAESSDESDSSPGFEFLIFPLVALVAVWYRRRKSQR
ncbi:MAG: hypothetical protein ACFFGZ_13495 [Candidatus Thorarchaeota archaeon]